MELQKLENALYVAFGGSCPAGRRPEAVRLTFGPSPAKPNAMFSDVLTRRGLSHRRASDSSADAFSTKPSSALEFDAHRREGPQRAKTSGNIVFGFAGGGPKVSLTAPWPPPFRTGPAKRYVQRVFELLERVRPSKPRELQQFAGQAVASHLGEQPGRKLLNYFFKQII